MLMRSETLLLLERLGMEDIGRIMDSLDFRFYSKREDSSE